MADDKDIRRAAEEMIKLHGLHADLNAAKRADQCLNQGDSKGNHTWRQVVTAIRDLRRHKPARPKP